MYLFSVPDSITDRMSNKILLYAIRDHKEWFYDDFQIETAYGCPDSCIWNGNRINIGITEWETWINVIVKMYTDFNIKFRLTFTNFLLEKDHLYDVYGNRIATALNNIGGYVMVSLPLMAKYMHKTYPNLKVCWSTSTVFEDGVQTINKLSKNTLVVLPYEYNNTPALDELQHPENIEILVNERCIDRCPRRREHWTNCNKAALLTSNAGSCNCFFPHQYGDTNLLRKHLVPRSKFPEYSKRGINHFKISGRLDLTQTWDAYLHYFVLPQYQQDFKNYADECNESNFGQGW